MGGVNPPLSGTTKNQLKEWLKAFPSQNYKQLFYVKIE
jgi:hypothetical protein